MKTKTITYQRVLNLGNYESKRLEMTAEIYDFDDLEFETSFLMEMVERKIMEDSKKAAEAELRLLRQELRELQQQVAAARSSQPEDDSIPGGF